MLYLLILNSYNHHVYPERKTAQSIVLTSNQGNCKVFVCVVVFCTPLKCTNTGYFIQYHVHLYRNTGNKKGRPFRASLLIHTVWIFYPSTSLGSDTSIGFPQHLISQRQHSSPSHLHALVTVKLTPQWLQ